jgi:hypothetical protein
MTACIFTLKHVLSSPAGYIPLKPESLKIKKTPDITFPRKSTTGVAVI